MLQPMRNKTRGSVLLRERRIKRDMQQNQLAETLGISAAMVSRYESGERRPRMKERKALFQLFRIPTGAWLEAVVQ